MKNLLFICLCLISLVSFTQKKETKIPRKIRKSIPLLTHYLTDQKSSDHEKVEAIYTWITENVEYDYDLLQSEKYLTGVEPKLILKAKKAICNGYVELMRSMLTEIGIKSETVSGYIHNMHWIPGKLAVKEEHAWIAIRVDEKWHLADPTWDAGYIGRIPTNLKPYKPKEYRKTKFKNPDKEKKVLEKREAKEIERKKAYDDKPFYTNEIGFVKRPKKDYFLIHSDSFLLTHLPIMPIWQLRDDFISIETFAQSEDSLKIILDQTSTNRQDFEMKTNDFIDINYLDQRIICGDEGATFNKYNPTIKALFYYNYMALINDKDLQKIARGSVFEISPEKYEELAAKNDTIIKYTKLYKEVEKVYYKQDKDFDKIQNSASTEKDKTNSKLLDKIEKLNEKVVANLEKEETSIKDNLEKINTMENKIALNYSKAINYEEPKDLQKQVVQKWIDSITMEINSLNVLNSTLDTLRQHSKFNDVISNIDYVEYLLKTNANYIPFNSYSTTEITDEIDSLINLKSENSMMLLTDSIPLEFMPKDIMTKLKRIESLIGKANADIKIIAVETKISAPFKYETFFQAKLLEATQIVKQINMKSTSFNNAVSKGLNKNSKTYKNVSSLMKEQVKLKSDKYNFISEETEKEHLRDVSLIKKIDADTKKWKKEYGGKK